MLPVGSQGAAPAPQLPVPPSQQDLTPVFNALAQAAGLSNTPRVPSLLAQPPAPDAQVNAVTRQFRKLNLLRRL